MAEALKGVYRPRNPQATPFYHLVEDHGERLKNVYPDRYERQFGYYRPITEEVFFRYLDFSLHIPSKGEQVVRYYGWYSNKEQGCLKAPAMKSCYCSSLSLLAITSPNSRSSLRAKRSNLYRYSPRISV